MTLTPKEIKKSEEMRNVFSHWGIECGEGWKGLYQPLIERCQKEGVSILQIKEKFGGLRFYVGSGASEALRQSIDDAERRSYHVCEQCGDVGSRRDGSWIKTLCDAHAKKKG